MFFDESNLLFCRSSFCGIKTLSSFNQLTDSRCTLSKTNTSWLFRTFIKTISATTGKPLIIDEGERGVRVSSLLKSSSDPSRHAKEWRWTKLIVVDVRKIIWIHIINCPWSKRANGRGESVRRMSRLDSLISMINYFPIFKLRWRQLTRTDKKIHRGVWKAWPNPVLVIAI